MILILDNDDSFTFNLAQLVQRLAGEGLSTRVVRRRLTCLDEVLACRPSHIVISPGPGHPRDLGWLLRLFDALATTPILGVCLGHQALALTCGGSVGRSPRPTHGRAMQVLHGGGPLFERLPSPFPAALYHSLAVERGSLPAELEVAAWSAEGDIMALRRRDRPHFGVQFHPESFLTRGGDTLVTSFLAR